MSTIADIAEEIEAEARAVKRDVVLTTLTLLGLLIGSYSQFTEQAVWITISAFVLAYVAGGLPATKEALTDLRQGSLNIDLLMVTAALAAAGVGEVRDGAILLFLFSLAGTLEAFAMGRTKRAVAALMQLRPDEAHRLLANGETERVAVEALAIGDQVIVKPGDRLPVDGAIVSGFGAIDQSSVTGESVPVDKVVGDLVFAGTVNQNSVLTVSVTRLAHQSTLAKMIELVTAAQEKRSPSERFSDWFGQRYTFVVLFGSLAALGGFLLFGLPLDVALYKAATLLVVASPCAIVISVPAAILSALAVSARHGVLFKGGAALELFGQTTTIAFDKTGTLTEGKMSVQTAVSFGIDQNNLLQIVASLEAHSEHPIAKSIVSYARAAQISPQPTKHVTAIPGQGITGELDEVSYWAGNERLAEQNSLAMSAEQEVAYNDLLQHGKTVILVGQGKQLLGMLGVADTVRTSAKVAIEMLRDQGIKTAHMFSGDNQLVANVVGAEIGIPQAYVHGSLLPDQKVSAVESLRQKEQVAFVGDGVNDAPALVTAQVGIAMGVAGSDVALEAADVALLSDDLTKLAYAHRLSLKANAIIRQNLIFAVGIMLIMVIMTIFFHLPLPLGVLGHEGGTILVVLNGLRLLWQKI